MDDAGSAGSDRQSYYKLLQITNLSADERPAYPSDRLWLQIRPLANTWETGPDRNPTIPANLNKHIKFIIQIIENNNEIRKINKEKFKSVQYKQFKQFINYENKNENF